VQPLKGIGRLHNMKFALFFIAVFLGSVHLFAQEKHFIAEQVEPGKCYVSAILADKASSGNKQFEERWLHIKDTRWKSYTDTLILDLPDENWDRDYFEIVSKRVLIKPATTKWLKKEVSPNCISVDVKQTIAFCQVEQSAQYKTIYYLIPLDSSYQKEITLDTLILEKYKLQENGEIYEVTQPDTSKVEWLDYNELVTKDVKSNYYVYLEKGNWTNYREVNCGTGCGGGDLPMKINKRLKELGYDVNKGNIVDEKMKAALTHYIKKHGLANHGLDLNVLRSLGIEY